MNIRRTLSEYRWPIYLGALLLMPIVASGVLVYVATRADSPRPIANYYQSAKSWDADAAVAQASRDLGWTVRYEFPAEVPHFPGMPRPVDVTVADRDGRPISGLAGDLFAIRPADARRNQRGALVELPQQRGSYRTLVLIDDPGAWELRLDTRQEALRFVHAARVRVAPDLSWPDGGAVQ